MTKTLRITSILIAFLAVALIVPAFFGSSIDLEKDQFLNAPSVVDNFRKNKAGRTASKADKISPLVKQAQAFALYLNPPPPPKPRTTERTTKKRARTTPKPKTVAAKFDIIGTSYYPTKPELSLALIDEPGKGLRWVRQSAKIGHLVIEQVKDGVVVIRDGERTYEIVSKRPIKQSLVKGEEPISKKSGGVPVISLPKLSTPAKPAQKGVKKPQVAVPKQPSPKDLAEIEGFLKKLGAIEAEKGRPPSDAEWMKMFMEIDSIREREANNLELLGKQLETAEKDPNKPSSNKVAPPKVPARRPRTRRR